MRTIKCNEIAIPALHALLLGAVAPRPIALVSTISKEGKHNLSPFSFFNIFSANPPIAIFSPAKRVRDNTSKHTLENVREVPEAVIQVVNYDMVHQTSLSSTEYPKGVNEFVKSGFTPLSSELVRPLRVKESPVQMECKVNEIVPLGDKPGSGNLVICEILLLHINESVFDVKGKIDPNKIDLVARMGADWYCRASGLSLFEVEKPLSTLGIGVDQIPEYIRLSTVLTGNNLGQLGNIEQLPTIEEILEFKNSTEGTKLNGRIALHSYAQKLLTENKVYEAWKVLLCETI
jgi:flavin reductase (DIM6/NTAB) family NADH-FMN oxidoreductase RutF